MHILLLACTRRIMYSFIYDSYLLSMYVKFLGGSAGKWCLYERTYIM